MSKKLVTALVLVWGTALAANCGGGSDQPANGNGGSGGNGAGGDSSGGTKAGTAGSAGKGGTNAGGTNSGGTAGKGGTGGNAGSTSQAGQSMGGEAAGGSPGAAGMSAAGDTGAGGTPGAAGAGGAGGSGAVDKCPATIDLYPGIVAKAICDKRVDCCMSDANQCMTDVGDALDQIFTDLVQSEKDGLTATNCDALAKCVAAISAADCKNWPTELGTNFGIPVDEPACRHFIEPLVKPAAACTDNYQCIDGYCLGNTPVCVAFVADGNSCAAAGSLCNTVTSYCDANNKCSPQLANGKDCSTDTDCLSRICDGGTNKCAAPDPKNDCEFTPSGCSLVSASPRGGLGWSLIAGFMALGVVARRRRRC